MPVEQIRVQPILPTINAAMHPFSNQLMDCINGVRNQNIEVANANWHSLLNYLDAHVTAEEADFLVITNTHPLTELLNDLRDTPQIHEILRVALGAVVMNRINAPQQYDINVDEFNASILSDDDQYVEIAGAYDDYGY